MEFRGKHAKDFKLPLHVSMSLPWSRRVPVRGFIDRVINPTDACPWSTTRPASWLKRIDTDPQLTMYQMGCSLLGAEVAS